jgi:hypothetical protein
VNDYPTTVLTREQLYELVWNAPTRKVAQGLGISDVGLAKICRRFHIPRPWRGYWREKETGHRPRQPKMPPLRLRPRFHRLRPEEPPLL